MEAAAASRTTLCALPLALLQSVLALLPVDARARACVVCPAWNAALAERSLWARLDLSPASSVAVVVTNEVLEAAAARAGGQLEALDLNHCDNISLVAVLAVATANGATLRELRCRDNPSTNMEERHMLASEDVETLLRAAPQLRVLDVDVRFHTVAEASRLLRSELLFAPLRVRALMVHAYGEHPDEAAVLSLAADVAGHAWLAELALAGVPLDTAAALDALADDALARRLSAVRLMDCRLSPASAPALVRLVRGGLALLGIICSANAPPMLEMPAALLLSNALRASTTLTSVHLCRVALWHDPFAAVLLLGALAGHHSLRELDVSCNEAATPVMQAIAGAALGAVVGANAPALRTLDVAGGLPPGRRRHGPAAGRAAAQFAPTHAVVLEQWHHRRLRARAGAAGGAGQLIVVEALFRGATSSKHQI
jgi:hypothetical protein